MFKNKQVLVTGGTGMVGNILVTKLIHFGASVSVASLDNEENCHPEAKFFPYDLTDINLCDELCTGMDYVFHVAGIKGSPIVCAKRPASFFTPLIQMNTNMMDAAERKKVKRYLYTSSVGVYAPAPIFYEDSVWKTFPSDNDRFAGWAKRMGELQAEAYKIENPEFGKNIRIVRPVNIYGPRDNFDEETGMVVPSLIARAERENPLTVWGDGSPIRDFIFAGDVADGMLKIFESDCNQPVNLGSGTGVSIKKLAETIAKKFDRDIVWDTTKPMGDKYRVADTKRAKKLGFEPKTNLKDGIDIAVDWYLNNRKYKRHDVFKEK